MPDEISPQPDEISPQQEPFDLDKLQKLIEMMEQHGLTEVNLQRGDEKWRLRRGPQEVVSMIPPAGYPSMSQASAAQPAPPPQGEAPSKPPAAEAGVLIKSPTVGTYYSAPSPDDPPFVTVGSKIQPDTVVCIIEAMKVFNQIPAEVNGTIGAILVENGESVEFGQPLFRVV